METQDIQILSLIIGIALVLAIHMFRRMTRKVPPLKMGEDARSICYILREHPEEFKIVDGVLTNNVWVLMLSSSCTHVIDPRFTQYELTQLNRSFDVYKEWLKIAKLSRSLEVK